MKKFPTWPQNGLHTYTFASFSRWASVVVLPLSAPHLYQDFQNNCDGHWGQRFFYANITLNKCICWCGSVLGALYLQQGEETPWQIGVEVGCETAGRGSKKEKQVWDSTRGYERRISSAISWCGLEETAWLHFLIELDQYSSWNLLHCSLTA